MKHLYAVVAFAFMAITLLAGAAPVGEDDPTYTGGDPTFTSECPKQRYGEVLLTGFGGGRAWHKSGPFTARKY